MCVIFIRSGSKGVTLKNKTPSPPNPLKRRYTVPGPTCTNLTYHLLSGIIKEIIILIKKVQKEETPDLMCLDIDFHKRNFVKKAHSVG